MSSQKLYFGDTIYLNLGLDFLAACSSQPQPSFVALNSTHSSFHSAHFQILPVSMDPLPSNPNLP